MSSKPKMNTSDPVTNNLDKRKYLIIKPSPKVYITVKVIEEILLFIFMKKMMIMIMIKNLILR
jgi:hypothetical protein